MTYLGRVSMWNTAQSEHNDSTATARWQHNHRTITAQVPEHNRVRYLEPALEALTSIASRPKTKE